MDIVTVLLILFVGFGLGIIVAVMNKAAAFDETFDSGYSTGWEHAMRLQKEKEGGE